MNTTFLISDYKYSQKLGNNAFLANFAPTKAGRTAAQPSGCEESPDRKGHPAAESAEGSNLLAAAEENNRRKARVRT
jgi:hypothetical protein